MVWAGLFSILVLKFLCCAALREERTRESNNEIYHNQFAVHIPSGCEDAEKIAAKYGFNYMGQIGSLENYFLFEHEHVHRRSSAPSHLHHSSLASDPLVAWAEQQVEKRRVKRDGLPLTHDPPSLPHVAHHLESEEFPQSLSYRGRRQFLRPFISSFFKPQTTVGRGIGRFSDPLWSEQWYLSEGATGGFDMNVTPAWDKGYTGKGVVVSILDDGIQHNHPDLAQNYDPRASTDINDNDADPMPQDNGDNRHGTRCAGEVASVAFNNYCGVGIAYNASIGGVRMLDGTVNDAVEARAISLNPDYVDIYSASWGPEDDGRTVDGPGPLAKRAFINGVLMGRHGKGSIFVWASGNGGRHIDNCNCDGYTNSIFTLSISSATMKGFKPWYLEECSSTLSTTYSSGSPGIDRGIATVDMDGSLRHDRLCTTEHTGTSASAPLAAGICALALEANPDLTWRDMQHLVVRTSRWEPLRNEDGWFVNGVGRRVSHKFGYGLMDAGAMVNLAEQWTTVPPQHVCQSIIDQVDKTIPVDHGSSITTHITTDGCAGTTGEVRYLEHVQARISLRFLPRGNLNIKLVSPSETSSVLLFERPRDNVAAKFDDWPFLSVHFWGEQPAGTWKLIIKNAGNRLSHHTGVLIQWQLILHGTKESPDRTHERHFFLTPSTPPLVASPTFSSHPLSFMGFFNQFFSASGTRETYVALDGGTTDEAKSIPGYEEQGGANSSNVFVKSEVCHSECLGGCFGPGPDKCKTCKHFNLGGECISHCPEGTYGTQKGRCLPCHSMCSLCHGANINQCLGCHPPFLHISDETRCVNICPVGYLQTNRSCLPCNTHCAKCSDPSWCQACGHHLLLFNGTCLTYCPRGYYETENNTCEPCNTPCATCVGGRVDDCASCPDYMFISNGKCVHHCPQGTYGNPEVGECVLCPLGCSSCSSSDSCSLCQEGWRLKSGRCVAFPDGVCGPSEFEGKNGCSRCDPTCLSCIGPSAQDCIHCALPRLLHSSRCTEACPRGFFLFRGRCAPCRHGCSSCDSYLSCAACDPRFRRHLNTCIDACPPGTYADKGVCVDCDPSCATCWGPGKAQCASCAQDAFLLGTECFEECPRGHYAQDSSCKPCFHNCATCSGPSLNSCTSCHPDMTLDGGMCVDCEAGHYYDAPSFSCQPCHRSCLTCNGASAQSCTRCQIPLSLHVESRSCLPCCSGREEPDALSPHCCHCDVESGVCPGSKSADRKRIAQIPTFGSQVSQPPSSLVSSFVSVVVVICLVNIVIFGVTFTLVKRGPILLCCRSKYSYSRLSTRAQNSADRVSLTLTPFTEYYSEEEEGAAEDSENEDYVLYTRT